MMCDVVPESSKVEMNGVGSESSMIAAQDSSRQYSLACTLLEVNGGGFEGVVMATTVVSGFLPLLRIQASALLSMPLPGQ